MWRIKEIVFEYLMYQIKKAFLLDIEHDSSGFPDERSQKGTSTTSVSCWFMGLLAKGFVKFVNIACLIVNTYGLFDCL